MATAVRSLQRGKSDSLRGLAERMGFEPTVQLYTVQRFSKPPPSATRPPLQRFRVCPRFRGASRPISALPRKSGKTPPASAFCPVLGLAVVADQPFLRDRGNQLAFP